MWSFLRPDRMNSVETRAECFQLVCVFIMSIKQILCWSILFVPWSDPNLDPISSMHQDLCWMILSFARLDESNVASPELEVCKLTIFCMYEGESASSPELEVWKRAMFCMFDGKVRRVLSLKFQGLECFACLMGQAHQALRQDLKSRDVLRLWWDQCVKSCAVCFLFSVSTSNRWVPSCAGRNILFVFSTGPIRRQGLCWNFELLVGLDRMSASFMDSLLQMRDESVWNVWSASNLIADPILFGHLFCMTCHSLAHCVCAILDPLFAYLLLSRLTVYMIAGCFIEVVYPYDMCNSQRVPWKILRYDPEIRRCHHSCVYAFVWHWCTRCSMISCPVDLLMYVSSPYA